MYMYYGQNFIDMIKAFNSSARDVAGGREIVCRCRECGDSKDPKHAHMYISVPSSSEEISLYNCKKCNARGIVDDIFLRRYGCSDSRVLIDIVRHNAETFKNPSYAKFMHHGIFPLKNIYISNQVWNQLKLDYINQRIGSHFTFSDLLRLKIFLNLYDVLSPNNLEITRDRRICDALNEHFMGFISYDNSYAVLRKCDDSELYKSINKRYIVYNLTGKFDNSKDFYVIPTSFTMDNSTPVRIHIAEGVFDILSIYYNLRGCNMNQEIYITSSGKSYAQALAFILQETGIINYEIHIYPDKDVDDRELNRLIMTSVRYIPCTIYIHRNSYPGEKDYGVPLERIHDTVIKVPERIV